MSRMPLFASPLLLGFEDIERAVDRISKSGTDGYSPYNVEQLSEHRLRITLAVAGFTADDLSVQLEGNQLVIRGKQAESDERFFLHRGIATRQFQRSFLLADGIEVTGASLDHGLLRVDLDRPLEDTRVQRIEIATASEE